LRNLSLSVCEDSCSAFLSLTNLGVTLLGVRFLD